jgi:hypothetical protein
VKVPALVAALLLLAGTACTASGSPPPGASSTESPFEVPDEVEDIGCGDPVQFRGPDGRRLDLTGLWAGSEAAEPDINVRQVGSCLFATPLLPSGPPEYYNWVCDGTIGSDFVITARCIDFQQREGFQPDMGREYFLISFDEDGGPQLFRCLDPASPATCDTPLVPWEPPRATPTADG